MAFSLTFFSKKELEKIHRRFAHPVTDKLCKLLKKAAPRNYCKNTRAMLEEIVKYCQSCQRMAPKPFFFQVPIPDDIQFNHEVILDLRWIEPRPHKLALHVVDRGTRFSSALFVDGESAEDVWNAFISWWASIYIGFPNIHTHDFGSCFTSEFFKKSGAEFGIITKEVLCESHNSLGPGEWYHAPLKRIYKKLKEEQPDLSNELRYQLQSME